MSEAASATPFCVVRPSSVGQVRDIVAVANERKTPIVPYGGGSGLMGGALSVMRGIVLDMRDMDRVVAVDRDAMTATVEAGAVLEPVEKKLNERGLMLGHDPWTFPVATVGGAISTDGLGYRGGKYGSMGDQVLGIEAVLPLGSIIRTPAVSKRSTGIDLKRLLIGGEGCFGIITEATLRVFPAPEKRSLSAYRFASFEQGFAAVQTIYSKGLKPAVMDFGDDAEKFGGDALLYLGFEGVAEVVEAEERAALALCDRGGGAPLPREEAERFWRDRHRVGYLFAQNRGRGRGGGGWGEGVLRDWLHVALPVSRVVDFRRMAIEMAGKRGVCLEESGVWTHPELFSLRLAIAAGGDGRLVLADTVDELLRRAHEAGGSMEYCHGVGVKLARLMEREHDSGLEAMRRIKQVLDPNQIMNPGKLGL
jgi:alkyldihydroxyacetonephosphate synthase